MERQQVTLPKVNSGEIFLVSYNHKKQRAKSIRLLSYRKIKLDALTILGQTSERGNSQKT